MDGIITDEAIELMQNGVEIGIEGIKYLTKPCLAKKIEAPIFPPRAKAIRDERHGPTTWASILLREGKFRQVRKMTAVVKLPTLRLIRVRIGVILLENLSLGQVKEVEGLM